MTPGNTAQIALEDRKLLLLSAGAALILETVIILATGITWNREERLSTPNEDSMIEVHSFETIPQRKLVSEKAPPVKKADLAINKNLSPKDASTAQSNPLPSETQNQIAQAKPLPPNHGPVAIYSPAPVIPSYLQNQVLETFAVVLFYVSAKGEITPRLIRSSGNTELDMITLETVRQWKFRPAEKNSKPTDDKVSLKIIFEVK